MNNFEDKEYNNLDTDNTATNFNATPDNTKTSDELDAPISYGYEYPVRETNFAKLKKNIKIIKIAACTVTVTVTGGALVVVIRNNMVAKEIPKVENYEVNVINKFLSYKADLSNMGKYTVFFEINKGGQIINKDSYTNNGHIEKSYDLSAYIGEITTKLGYGNGVDYYISLKENKFVLA